MSRAAVVTALALLAGSLTGPVTAAAVPVVEQAAPQVRVNQVGYPIGATKTAYLMTAKAKPGERFTVVDGHGRPVLGGRIAASTGRWSAAYGAVQPIDLSRLDRPGSYRIRAAGATSPVFRVATARTLFGPLVDDTVTFFQVQRDGGDVVPGLLHRKPSHLADRRATVYHQPVFTGDGGDVPAAPLQPYAGLGPADVEGGWFDAGDYVKFAHATAYSLSELLYVQRMTNRPALRAETRHGLTWLDKLWDPDRKVLYAQIGIGTGSEEFGFLGDHDVWRLPEADDRLRTGPGDESRYLKYRPVFPAAAPGAKVSPNLAGRMSAAFALASQLAPDRRVAKRWLAEAAGLYADAKTTDVGELVTAFPHAYYPEDSWQDDMEFGATELALAARRLGDHRAGSWTKDAVKWARAYVASDSRDALNLYDTSALAHADLARLVGRADRAVLVRDLRRQLDAGVEAAAEHPFGHAADVTDFDAATRSFGFAATAGLYRGLTGDHRYDAFGTRQRDFALGANAWGTSLVIGAGTVFPHCPQHQVANLSGSLDGGRRVIRGAVVNGPNGAENFEDIGIPDGAEACPADGGNRFAAFDTTDSRYLDDVRAWPSSEPAIDFTSTAMLAFALAQRAGGMSDPRALPPAPVG